MVLRMAQWGITLLGVAAFLAGCFTVGWVLYAVHPLALLAVCGCAALYRCCRP
jgi:hypothetical protein